MLEMSRDEDLGLGKEDLEHGSKSHLSSAANGFDPRDFMISANFLQKKILGVTKEGNRKAGDTRDGVERFDPDRVKDEI
jgi:hypothetical protein